MIQNGTHFVSALALPLLAVAFALARLCRLIAPPLAQLTISARWLGLHLVGLAYLVSWHASLSTFAPPADICFDSSLLMALLAVRWSRHALLLYSLRVAEFARLPGPPISLIHCLPLFFYISSATLLGCAEKIRNNLKHEKRNTCV